MSQIFKITVFLLTSLVIHAQSISPSVLASSGGEGSTADNSVAWTMGELSIMTLERGDNILTQGFHQPNLIITGTSSTIEIGLDLYPNPAQDQLILEYDGDEIYDFHLLNVAGQKAMEGRLLSGKNELDVRNLSSGTYILAITDEERILKTFKIEKTGR